MAYLLFANIELYEKGNLQQKNRNAFIPVVKLRYTLGILS